MTIDEIHQYLAKGALGSGSTDDDGVSLLILLNTHRIWLRDAILSDRPGILSLAAITQRHAADVVAATWPDRADRDRIGYHYWYHLFNTDTHRRIADVIPPDLGTRIERIREWITNKAEVARIEPED